MHKIFAILLLIVMPGIFYPGLDAAPKKLTILQTTDIHGSIGDEKVRDCFRSPGSPNASSPICGSTAAT